MMLVISSPSSSKEGSSSLRDVLSVLIDVPMFARNSESYRRRFSFELWKLMGERNVLNCCVHGEMSDSLARGIASLVVKVYGPSIKVFSHLCVQCCFLSLQLGGCCC
jgi:hypothetical protein